MIDHDNLLKLKKQAIVYCRKAVDVVIEDDDQHFCEFGENKAIIHLGKNAPYRYAKTLHSEGYYLFMEGLNIHEIAQIKYTNFQIFKDCFHQGEVSLLKANELARKYLKKEVSVKELKKQIYDYVYYTNLPLLLKAIEDGAIENSMGIEHPETWTALMFARHHISHAFMNKKQNVNNTQFLMDKIIKEIMVICTYGYRYHLYNSIIYLPKYLPDDFENIRKLSIKGRLQSQTTSERLNISKEILNICQPVMNETVMEIFDTVRNSQSFEGLGGNDLFSSMQSEISVNFQNNQNESNTEKTKSKYQLDLSDEDFRRIEQIENQEEKNQQHQSLQEILKREKEKQKRDEKKLNQSFENDNIENHIITFPLQRTSPTQYGNIAMRSLNQSIQRSNKLARLLKREIMYASKNRTKSKLEYGRKLDQRNLYRANIDGRVFYERVQGNKKDLCVYILVDNSESMSGDKIVNTMKGCYEVARVLQTLKIPFCISAHKAVGDSVQMTEIISFQECFKRQLLDKIFYMHVSGGTHEEIALEKALKDLNNFKRNKKGFVFVLSDGDTHGVRRIHDLTRIYKKEKNIDVIGIGIQTAKKIEETYPQGMFIQDINNLPIRLVQKLREIAL